MGFVKDVVLRFTGFRVLSRLIGIEIPKFPMEFDDKRLFTGRKLNPERRECSKSSRASDVRTMSPIPGKVMGGMYGPVLSRARFLPTLGRWAVIPCCRMSP